MKLKLVYTLIFFQLGFTTVEAQVAIDWFKKYNSPVQGESNYPRSSALDNFGNIYVGGRIYSNSTTRENYFLIKYNPNGDTLWTRQYDRTGGTDEIVDMVIDNSNNIYVTGYSGDLESNYDFVTIKYNPNGVQQWVSIYERDSNSQDYGSRIGIDNSGNLYAGGHTVARNQADYDMLLIKYNSSTGDTLWTRQYNGPGNYQDNVQDLTVDNLGNVYICGYNNYLGGNTDGVLIKLNTSGTQQWISKLIQPSSGYYYTRSITIDISGNILVAGDQSYSSGSSIFTAKFNSSTGDSIWIKRYPGPLSGGVSNMIKTDASGNAYVCGRIKAAGQFGDIPSFITLKYNSSGIIQWAGRYTGPGETDDANSLALDGAGNIYVSGSSMEFNGIYNWATIKYNSGGDSLWVRRIPLNLIGPNGGQTQAMAVNNAGDVYVSGVANGEDIATVKYIQSKKLQLTSLIEGFFNPGTNTMVADTAIIYLRNVSSPYAIVDSAKSYLNSAGTGSFYFYNASNGTNYFIEVKHRNSLETWSKPGGEVFTNNFLNYNFTTFASQAYGNNVILKGTKYCIYSGDVNQDGSIDVSDVIAIYNDASIFMSGYVVTDVNGDTFTDVTDMLITYNNAVNFVVVRNPIVGN